MTLYRIIVPNAPDDAVPARQPDCACSSSRLQVEAERTYDDVLQLLDPVVFDRVNEDYTVALSPYSSHGGLLLSQTVVDALHADYRALPPTLIHTLVEHGILGTQATRLAPKRADTLEVWLHVTNACNLDCTYCYVNKSVQHMTEETGIAAIHAIFRSAADHGFARIKIKYAGGEPTLRFDLVQTCHRLAQRLAQTAGIELEGVLLTNGTLLTSSMIQTIQELGLKVALSIDGLDYHHDQQRATLGGYGSIQQVLDGLARLLDAGLTPFVTVTVTQHSAAGLREFIPYLLNRAVPFTLNFVRSRHPRQLFQFDDERMIQALSGVIDTIGTQLPPTSLLDGLLDRSDLEHAHSHTCGVGQNYVVINQLGHISQCQMHVHQPVGTLTDSDLLNAVRQGSLQNLPVDEKEGCKACEWRYWCAGGCPLQTYAATKRYDVKSPNCSIYKAVYPQAVKLEGKRLLQFGELRQFSDDPATALL